MSEKSLSNKIDQLISVIKNNVVAPVAPVAPVLPIAPIAPVHNDYDNTILIKVIDAKVDRLILDVASINSNYAGKIEKIESNLIGKVTYEEDKKLIWDKINQLLISKDSQTILISIGIGLLAILTAILLYHIFGVKV